jgi:hypothetical protein
MEDRVQAFLIGFVAAGIIGILSTIILKSWNTIDKTSKQMFSNPPKPALKPSTDSNIKGIGTDPDQSPLKVLSNGCFTIIGHLLFQIAVVMFMTFLFIQFMSLPTTPETLTGILFAAIIGFILQQFRKNWKKISDLYKQITNPPNPILNMAGAPNNHYLAAKPSVPAFSVVTNGLLEIGLRLVWGVVLICFLCLSLWLAYLYVTKGVTISGVRGFGT